MSEHTSSSCADGGADLHGVYCSDCGQKATDNHRAITHLGREFFETYFSVDAKMFKSLLLPAGKPGFLTAAYLSGRRTRYIPPLKLFLIVSVLSLFVSTVLFPVDSDALIRRLTQTLETMNQSLATVVATDQEQELHKQVVDDNPVLLTMQKLHEEKKLTPFMNRVFNRMPTLLFIMMPLMALLLRLLYVRHGNRLYFVDHLIFSLHMHTFFFLTFGVKALFPDLLIKEIIFNGIVGAYLLLAMKKVYGQSWGKTFIKWVMLSALFGFAFFFGFAILMLSHLFLTDTGFHIGSMNQ